MNLVDRSMTRRFLIVLGCLALVFQLSARVAGEPGKAAAKAAKPTVAMLPGFLQPNRKVIVGSGVEGVLIHVSKAEGDRVHRGEVLAVVDNRAALGAMKLAEAEAARQSALARAESELRAARGLLERMTMAESHQAASALEVDRARAGVETAEAAVAQAKEQREEARLKFELERTRLACYDIVAPFDGQIVSVAAEAGQSVTLQSQLFTLVDTKSLRADLHLPVEWYGKLAQGETYSLAVDTPVDGVVPARLRFQEQAIETATRTFRCVFEVNNSDGELPGGALVTLCVPEKANSTARRATADAESPSPETTEREIHPVR